MHKAQLGDNHPNTATSLNNLATLYQSQDDIPQAIEFLSQGIAVEEYNLSQNLNIGDEKQKRDYIATVSGTTDGIISLNLQSAPNNPEATRLALKTILQRKGRILDVLTNSQQILRQQINDPESQTLLEQLIQKQTQLSNLTFQRPETIKSPEIHRQQLINLQAETQQLEDKLSRRSAEFRNLSQPITLEAIQKLIPTNAALVEIVRYKPFNPKATKDSEKFGNPHYAVYILFANGEIKAQDLGEAQPIDEQVTAFRRNLADSKTPIPQLKKSAR
ncbi:MAG: tetratricopeptide repeat protein, partial [Snowella sp.]